PPASPDFTDTWPVHCVAGTDGAALHEAVAAVQERVEIVHKGYGVPSYSVLEGTVVDTGEPVQQLLEGGDWARIDVVGLAYDFCVRATALGAREVGAPVRVLREMTAAVHPEGVAAREEEVAAAGGGVVRPGDDRRGATGGSRGSRGGVGRGGCRGGQNGGSPRSGGGLPAGMTRLPVVSARAARRWCSSQACSRRRAVRGVSRSVDSCVAVRRSSPSVQRVVSGARGSSPSPGS